MSFSFRFSLVLYYTQMGCNLIELNAPLQHRSSSSYCARFRFPSDLVRDFHLLNSKFFVLSASCRWPHAHFFPLYTRSHCFFFSYFYFFSSLCVSYHCAYFSSLNAAPFRLYVRRKQLRAERCSRGLGTFYFGLPFAVGRGRLLLCHFSNLGFGGINFYWKPANLNYQLTADKKALN